MPTTEWLKKEFDYGYDSGNVTDWFPNRIRRAEEKKIGGSYRRVFRHAILPFINNDSTAMELGPGNGAWSRAILNHLKNGKLITLDYQDVSQWLMPHRYHGRLECHQVNNNSFEAVENESIDFFWSMGVLCHNNQTHVEQILANSFGKLRSGGFACHQYSDWEKLTQFGWQKGGVPEEFRDLSDDEIWWPRNGQKEMQDIAQRCGWEVVTPDLDLVQRDSIVLLRKI